MYKCEVCGRECDDKVIPRVLNPSTVNDLKEHYHEWGCQFCPIISDKPIRFYEMYNSSGYDPQKINLHW